MRIRFIKIILFFPSLIIDGLKVVFIILPYWLFIGEKQKFSSTLEELFEE